VSSAEVSQVTTDLLHFVYQTLARQSVMKLLHNRPSYQGCAKSF